MALASTDFFLPEKNDSKGGNIEHSGCIKLFHLNIQCLSNKVDMLSLTLDDLKSDIVCISEHWLTSEALKNVGIRGYNLQASYCRGARLHGGVAIFIRDGIDYRGVNLSRYSSPFHAEFAGVELSNKQCLIVVLYRSSLHGKFDIFFEHLDKLLSCMFDRYKNLIISGDFNCDPEKHPNEARILEGIMSSYALVPTIHGYTRITTNSASRLDNIYVNFDCDTYKASIYDPAISDHAGQIISLTSEHSVTPPNFQYKRTISAAGMSRLKQTLRNFEWENLLGDLSGEQAVSVFMDLLVYCMDQCEVVKVARVSMGKNSSINWFTDELKSMRCRLEALKAVCNVTQNESDWTLYRSYRSSYRARVAETKKTAYNKFISSSQSIQKDCWRVINQERTSTKIQILNKSRISVETFNCHFSKIADKIMKSLPDLDPPDDDDLGTVPINSSSMFLSPVTRSEVLDTMQTLKNKNGLDYYSMNARLIKYVCDEVVQPLTTVVNRCFMEGVFPNCLKVNKVIPVHKKGSLDDPENYRPIAICPVIAKIFEIILRKRLLSFFMCNRILNQQQFGFQGGLSTVHAVLRLLEDVVFGFDGGSRTEVTLCDLTKAFDCVSPSILLKKLEACGVRGVCLRLLKSYFVDRRQYVSLNDSQSQLSPPLTHGIPQGSIIGPLLFLVYINDLPNYINSAKTLLFADDTTFYSSHPDIAMAKTNVRDAVDTASIWFTRNKLSLNRAKTQSITLATDRNVPPQEPVSLLGIKLDQRLTWASHVDQVCARVSSGMYVLRGLVSLVSIEVLKMAYFALIHSHLTYGVLLWGGSAESQRAFVLQKKAIRVMLRRGTREHCKPLFRSLGILTLPSLFIYETCLHIHGKTSSLRTRSDVHDYNTRGRDLLLISQSRTRTSEKNKVNLKIYNSLPNCMKTLTLSKFKTSLKLFLRERSFYGVQEFLDATKV